MASPAKQQKIPSDSVVGFLHAVSPLKNSRRNIRYFEATLQTGREEYHRVVAFSVDKRIAFVQASDNKSPVQLANVRRTVSFSDPSGFDVLCSNASSLNVVENISFFPREPSNMGQMRIAEVLGLGPRQRVGMVEVKILPEGIVSKVVTVAGAPCELKEFRICDPTGQTSLTLWEKQIMCVQVTRSYRLENLSTRKMGERTVLTSTPSTTATEIPDVGEPESIEAYDESRDRPLRGTVSGVQIVIKYRCRRCHGSQEEFESRSATNRCRCCKLLQRTSSFILAYSGVLELNSDGKYNSLIFTHSSVSTYLREQGLMELCDVEAIEKHLINIGEVEGSMNGEGLILSLRPCAVNEQGGADLEGVDAEGSEHDVQDVVQDVA